MTRPSRYEQDLRQVLAAVRALQADVRTLKTLPPCSGGNDKGNEDKEDGPKWYANPILVLILGGIVTALLAIPTLLSAIQLEREKLRSTLIQEASKSADEATTLKTLKFLVKTKLIQDEGCTIAKLTVEDVPYFGAPTPYRPDQLEEMFGRPLIPGTNKVDPAWRGNLVPVTLPDLPNAPKAPKSLLLHTKVARDFTEAIEEIKRLKMEGQILEISSFEPGLVRDPVTGILKTGIQSYGIAVSINASKNPFRTVAPPGSPGSNYELEKIFRKHRFYWAAYHRDPAADSFRFALAPPNPTTVNGEPAGTCTKGFWKPDRPASPVSIESATSAAASVATAPALPAADSKKR